MKHADTLIQRILFLDRLPNVQRLDQVSVGETVEEILQCDLKLEEKAILDLREGIAYCETVRDFVSRDLFAAILHGEEEQVDFIETQFELIDRVGLENYIQLQSSPAE